MTIDEASQKYKVSKARIYYLLKIGKLSYVWDEDIVDGKRVHRFTLTNPDEILYATTKDNSISGYFYPDRFIKNSDI